MDYELLVHCTSDRSRCLVSQAGVIGHTTKSELGCAHIMIYAHVLN